ncbi:nitroreductase family deazaflavin-dependent oxidoreductase [Hoyosella sp. G463]|uniref:Nitroreductase family deazaflavin-dependent oxidoreductase n=1 Tax=Lolliginicoccus lacisalsi TaxID=2742202 RepID=A0A927J9A1_9ACTN|nr:nitroreductase/quinone reductase family protein [Lolliginicoccus lacisalsi]MBD8504871.1 nitroreductase family deazaflavin-dependent oxidoreductase [Lolliginicoccus lacisalsi]
MARRNPRIGKFRRERWIGRHLANPAVRALDRIGVRSSVMAELETIGRKSGRPRVVPVGVAVDGMGAWLISQHGYSSGWAHNIEANPNVRLRISGRWRPGVAEFRPDDDVVARSRGFSTNPLFARLVALTFRALESDPITVRVDFTE